MGFITIILYIFLVLCAFGNYNGKCHFCAIEKDDPDLD